MNRLHVVKIVIQWFSQAVGRDFGGLSKRPKYRFSGGFFVVAFGTFERRSYILEQYQWLDFSFKANSHDEYEYTEDEWVNYDGFGEIRLCDYILCLFYNISIPYFWKDYMISFLLYVLLFSIHQVLLNLNWISKSCEFGFENNNRIQFAN